ncbi:hypothetical protein [Tolypothrix sp. PCC 7601]|uniref:hypothetical protein n=1 Tax=Tolypothrix sp. PCC 7601 TaxID=1188 RepID=UPI0005EAB7F6|nr:hypothetical protein [Tolypothrix sp. PCC 7601]EKE98972.1 hypothetical protein FDUTEX481_03160 [Tolypothrix sp. PCC 7601]UYD35654.1 hypothetical protein HG267_07795 [Tolypothrix sp. PCC 7601]
MQTEKDLPALRTLCPIPLIPKLGRDSSLPALSERQRPASGKRQLTDNRKSYETTTQ